MYLNHPEFEQAIHPTAVIHASAIIGNNCSIGAGCYVGKNVQLGNNVILYANATILDNVTIGDNTTIWSGAVVRERCIIGSNLYITQQRFYWCRWLWFSSKPRRQRSFKNTTYRQCNNRQLCRNRC